MGMSQKTRLTQSALAVAVAMVSPRPGQQAFSLTNSLHRALVAPIQVKALLLMMRATPAVTRR